MSVTWKDMYNKIFSESIKRGTMASASFELTARCNLKCKMCYICEDVDNDQKKEKELSKEDWIHLARQARDEGLLYVTLTGGEVLLRQDFKEIYETMSNLGLLIQIYTNGTMITPEFASWLSKKPPYKVSITIYGASKETYQRVTGNAQAFERVIQGIDLLIENGIPVELKTTVVQGNAADLIELSNLATTRGLMLNIVNYISPRREGSNSDPVGNRLSPEALAEYEVRVGENNQKLQEENHPIKPDLMLFEDGQAIPNPYQIQQTATATESMAETATTTADKSAMREELPSKAFVCSASKCAAWFTWDGRMLPCGILPDIATYPLKAGFIDAWRELKQIASLVSTCEECSDCIYKVTCDVCPARLYGESGSYTKLAPYLCETAKARFANYQKKIGVV